MSYKIIDSLCYVPTEEIFVDLLVSLPPQMARYLKDVFGPRVAPLLGITADELYKMKSTLSTSELKEAIKLYLPITCAHNRGNRKCAVL